MDKTFLGVGWSFPVSVHDAAPSQGQIRLAQYEESVRQSIWLILGTAKGERVMRPNFGCEIYDLVFALNSASTSSRVTQAVRNALLEFEPRIDVQSVEVAAADGGETLRISIDYKVRATNNVFNLVYPFYLERNASP